MSALTPPPPSAAGSLAARRSLAEVEPRARRRARLDLAVRVSLTFAMALAVVPLLLIVFVVAREGYSVIDLGFFTQDTVPFRREGGGFRQGFFGTFFIMVLAIAMAIPTGIAAAVYLVEFGRGLIAKVIRFFTDVMTGVPSIFVGLFVYAMLVVGTASLGFGTLVAAVAIAIMMLPIVVRASEEMLKLVPDGVRNAAFGLGARRWQTSTRVVLPAAAPGLVTSSMLAIARGAGETAPLILTALGSLTLVTELQGARQSALPLLILDNATQPFAPGIARAWGGALCLLALTLLFTLTARVIGGRFTIRETT